ncbi:armadillo-type protein [Lipomyces arxii]|uniref:armadillo-type protein n=1 Tax=Lipomyces arxii TaxID=56418 RepID=UPI0034D016AB
MAARISMAPSEIESSTYQEKGNRGSLYSAVAHIFQEAQKSVTVHRKLSIKLWALQQQAGNRGYEEKYNEIFVSMLNRVLPVKKSEPCAKRVVKFCTQIVEYINTQDKQKRPADADSDVDMGTSDDEGAESTIGSRFVEFLLQHLLRGVDAKNKLVRYRVCQILALVVHSLGEIDDDLFQELRSSFVRRLHDKESSIRVQAVLGLSRLQGTDDDEEPEPISELLLNSLQHDSKAEVRRAVLLNLVLTHTSMPYALERARDMDTATRRSVYSRVLPEIGDFRLLSIGMREKILTWGLNDPEESVRNAATKTFGQGWLENTGNDILELLERLDVLNSKIAEQAIMELFAFRKDLVKGLSFPDALWESLTPETVFLAQAFATYCHESGLDDFLEEKLPEVTKLAFYAEYYSGFLDNEKSDSDIVVEKEFILEQLLTLCANLDYFDEMGRRKMFVVVRNILSKKSLPETVRQPAAFVLLKVSVCERNLYQETRSETEL